jgi:hypothetical protein
MYYNRVANKLSIDAIDYFLFCCFIFSSIGLYLREYFSERASKEKLRQDIIE